MLNVTPFRVSFGRDMKANYDINTLLKSTLWIAKILFQQAELCAVHNKKESGAFTVNYICVESRYEVMVSYIIKRKKK